MYAYFIMYIIYPWCFSLAISYYLNCLIIAWASGTFMHIVRFTSKTPPNFFFKFKYIFSHFHAVWGYKHFDLLTINGIKRWVKFTGKPCPKLSIWLVRGIRILRNWKFAKKLKFCNLMVKTFIIPNLDYLI